MAAPVQDRRRISAAVVPGRPALRVGPVSMVWRPRVVLVGVVTLVVVLVAVVLSMSRGDFPITPAEVVAVLLGGGARGQQFIVLDLRLPQTLTGALVGGALAVSGAITQSVSRNALASPDIIGFTSGAGAAAVFIIILGGGFGSLGSLVTALGLPLAALLGALVTATLIYALAWRKGIQGYRLVLVGIGINAVMLALVQWMLIVAQIFEAQQATVWLNGSLNARSWEHVIPIAVAVVVLVPLALGMSRQLGGLQFSDDTARGLGMALNGSRTGLLVIAVVLAAVSTSSAGPIAFVALVAPQVAQRLAGAARPPTGRAEGSRCRPAGSRRCRRWTLPPAGR